MAGHDPDVPSDVVHVLLPGKDVSAEDLRGQGVSVLGRVLHGLMAFDRAIRNSVDMGKQGCQAVRGEVSRVALEDYQVNLLAQWPVVHG